MGTIDGYDSLILTQRLPYTYCLPIYETAERLGDIVTDYLRENSGERYLSGAALAIRAVVRAFPCN
jgi:hypothetical protein